MARKNMKSRRKPLRKKAPKKPTVSESVKSYVNKVVHSNIEDKCVQINGGYSFGNVLESTDMNAYPMCPLSAYWSITQGVGQGGRIGNVIKTRKVYLNYVLRPLIYDATTNPFPQPQEVQLMLGYVRNTPSFAPVAGDIQQLFQAGSSVTAPVGSLRDLISVINTDYWVIKKKWTHKIGYASSTGTGSNANNQYFANNDFRLNVVKRLDITKFIPATHMFNDGGVTTNAKNLFFMQQAVTSDGGINNSTRLTANIEFWIDFHYEDA